MTFFYLTFLCVIQIETGVGTFCNYHKEYSNIHITLKLIYKNFRGLISDCHGQKCGVAINWKYSLPLWPS